ncbi:putative IQ motif, EF-hand binding protein [Helianthus anomalus]
MECYTAILSFSKKIIKIQKIYKKNFQKKKFKKIKNTKNSLLLLTVCLFFLDFICFADIASCSHRGRARKSGAGQSAPQQDSPQQDPVPQETPIIQIAADDPKLRKIMYQSSYNFILDRKCSRADHPILKFEPSTSEWNKYDKLKNTDLLQHREVADLLGPKLVDALECTQPQYEELVLEFHSTWMHKEGKFDNDAAVSFSLGRQVYEMNMARFTIVSGFYTEEEVKRPEFVTSLRGAYSQPSDRSVALRSKKIFIYPNYP